jgi:outer membrane receptor protein involved in Fe transport
MRILARLSLSLALLLLLIPAQLYAQATATGTIRGTVTDLSNAVVIGAQVTVVNTGTNLSRTLTTGAVGEFIFDQLPPGKYSIKASKKGFSSELAKAELLVGQTITSNFSLKPGAVNQVVEVSATTVMVDVEKTSVSQEVAPSEVEELPLLARDAANLAYLAPGVKVADSFDPTKNRSAVLSVNGNIGRDVNITVNGIDNKDSTVGGTVMQIPLEAVQEFLISTQRFSAANGRSEGAAINMITKSGTNAFHGSAFSYFREKQFNADQTGSDGTKSNPPYRRQFFGGSVGGPIKRDKLFTFFAYERQRENTSISEAGPAYTELTDAVAVGAVPATTIPTPFYENRYNGRLDYKFNDKETAYVSTSFQANNSNNDQEDGAGDLSVGNFTVNHMYISNFTLNSLLSPTLINAFTFGTQYWNNLISTKDPGAPYISFPDAWIGQSPNVSQQSFQRKWQWKDDVTKNKGKHTLAFGVDYVYTPGLGGFFNANSTLEIDYKEDPSKILAETGGFNAPGLVTSMSISNGDPANDVPGGTKQLGFYAQDDWKITKRLTVNLGLRWDKDFNLIGGSALKASKTFLELQEIGSSYGKMPHDDNKDFSPRVGFAYDLTGAGKHVLRGGFGIYYDNVFQNIPLWMEQQANAKVFQQALSITSNGTVPGLNIPLSQFVYSAANVAAITGAIPAATSELVSGSTGRTMDPNYRNPYAEEFNVGYQWAFAPNWVLEAEYTHTLGLHSNVDVNINPTDPDSPTSARPLDAAFGSLSCAVDSVGNYCVLGRVMDNRSIGRTRYDGFNLSVRHQLDKHFSLSANYTLSRAVGYGIESGGTPITSSKESSYHNYPHDPLKPLASWDFGPTPDDERHHITISGIANLPYGIEAAPILQFGSARPYDINSGYDILGLGSGYSDPVIVPNSDPKAYKAYADAGDGKTDPGDGARARADLSAGTAHIVPYDTLRGDPIFELDARISKNLKLGEGRRLQLSFQGFNLTNRANYGNNFSYVISAANFGKAAGFENPTSSSTAQAFKGEFGARFTF